MEQKKRIYETILSYYRNTFELDAPAPTLTTDIVRKVGGYVDVDFNLISPVDYYEGLKVEQEKTGSDIKQMKMKDWAIIGKLAWTNLQNNPQYYSDAALEEERIREFIRTEILGALTEAVNRKVYIKPGEQAPKGAKVSKGSRGGSYYYTKTTDARTKKGTRDLPGKPEKPESKDDKLRGDFEDIFPGKSRSEQVRLRKTPEYKKYHKLWNMSKPAKKQLGKQYEDTLKQSMKDFIKMAKGTKSKIKVDDIYKDTQKALGHLVTTTGFKNKEGYDKYRKKYFDAVDEFKANMKKKGITGQDLRDFAKRNRGKKYDSGRAKSFAKAIQWLEKGPSLKSWDERNK